MRVCYENVVLDGLRVPRIESVAATFSSSAAAAVSHSALITLFTGTADGALMMHDCRVGALSGAQPSTANTLDILRKQPKEKKPILQLTVRRQEDLRTEKDRDDDIDNGGHVPPPLPSAD